MRVSLEGKLGAIMLACSLLAAATGAATALYMESAVAGVAIGLLFALPLALLLVRRFTRGVNRVLQGLADGVASFRDGDFSMSLDARRNDELGDLVKAYDEIGEVLRRERQDLFQRELLLDTVIQSTPSAVVLCDFRRRIVYSNTAARRLFNNGRRLEGHSFEALLQTLRPEFLPVVNSEFEGLFSVHLDDDEEVFQLQRGAFTLNQRPHQLYLFRRMTREVNRQEVATWKKVIRVISHELNNSLAPIHSLAHSGRELLRRGDTARLEKVFAGIGDRAQHLRQFLEGYARFAKLPAPRPETVEWAALVDSLRELTPFRLVGTLPEKAGEFDFGQMQQVLLNLLRNAGESDSAPEEIELEVRTEAVRVRIMVRDRGRGMSDAVLQNALLPFYSTKKTGTGLGLALCREIVEAHGGSIQLANREGGGTEVSVLLPHHPPSTLQHGSL